GVGGVGVGLGEEGDDDFVDAGCGASRAFARPGRPGAAVPTWVVVGLNQFAQRRVARLEVLLQAKHGSGDGASFRARETDDADAAAAGGGVEGADAVVEVDGEIVMGRDHAKRKVPRLRSADASLRS